MVVKNSVAPPLRVEGQLTSMSSSLTNSLFSDPEDAVLRTKTYPFLLITDNYRIPGYIALGLTVILGFLLWRFAVPAWKHIQDISQHPVVRRAERWMYPTDRAMQAEREMTEAIRYKRAGAVVTQNFVIQRGLFTFNIFSFDDLLWAYKKVTRHSVNFIPTGKSYDGVLIFYGGNEIFKAEQKSVDELLDFAANRSPWAILGYSEELSRAFNKDTTGFCALVENRRQDWASTR